MTPEDQAKLKAHVEQALAASVKALGTLPRQPADSVRMPMDRCWALVNVESTQATLTDRAVRAMGGTAFTVTVDDTGVTIAPQAAPVPAPAPAPATH